MAIATIYAATHPSFANLSSPDHAQCAWELLTCTEALQDYISDKLSSHPNVGAEIKIEELEIVLGAGRKSAELAATLAGFTKMDKSNNWRIGSSEDFLPVRIPKNMLRRFMLKNADVIY